MKKMTLTQMKKANKAIGHSYFAKGAMRFFNAKIETQPNQYNLFIESQQFETDEQHILYTSRKYFLKYFNSENSQVVSITKTDSLPEYIETLEGAIKLKSIITKAFNDLAYRENIILDGLTFVETKKDWITFYGNVQDYNGTNENRSFNVSYDGRVCG